MRPYSKILSGAMRTVRIYVTRLVNGRLPCRRGGRGLLYVITGLILFILYRHLTANVSVDDSGEIDIHGHRIDERSRGFEKWIVATTIYRPTEALRYLSQQLSTGWKMVVVGDRKTPSNWHLNGVIYLDVDAQKSLGYKILTHLPYNTYSRKSIGYLYAIQHGAKYIYELDDDNFPYEELRTFQVTSEPTSRLVLVTKNLTYNPYVHFGQSTMWPRGYPLDKIGLPSGHDYKLCTTRTPAVQQGVVNGDPDVDAIFRLTRRQSSKPLNLSFDQAAPQFVLPSGTFAPFNSQNTLYAHNAFWILTLPTGVHDRVSDIYRAYWAQRLLRLVGEHVAFAPPNARQIRSGHSDLRDAEHETEMYVNVGRYVKVLNDWECRERFLLDCVNALSRHLVTEGLWQEKDAMIVEAWIADLSTVGYAPPALKTKPTDACVSAASVPVVFYPDEQRASMPNTEELHFPPKSINHELVVAELSSLCGESVAPIWKSALRKARKYDDILLVISVYTDVRNIVPLLEAFYKPHFGHVLYCVGQDVDFDFANEWKVSFIKLEDEKIGAVSCLSAGVRMGYHVKGAMHITDTMWLNAEKDGLGRKIASLAWMTGEFIAFDEPRQSRCAARIQNCRVVAKSIFATLTNQLEAMDSIPNIRKSKLRACLGKLGKDPSWMSLKETVWVTDIAMYLPSRLFRSLRELRQIFLADPATVAYDFMTVLLIECEQLTVEYLKLAPGNFHPPSTGVGSDYDYVYPFTFRTVAQDESRRKAFCEHFEKFK